ncbi:MAG: hypothetical protein D6800_06295, partial [Candidatus Zixiibacteriota bacterium]
VDTAAADVPRAKELLKPEPVVAAEERHHVHPRERDRRKNAAFIRQGEWFFVPEKGLEVDERMILRKEPLVRGKGKPHVADELFRCGGETVYVAGWTNEVVLTESEYRRKLQEDPSLKHGLWRIMTRNPEVYVRGRVRHPDHKTVTLRGWHRVYVNNERFEGKSVVSEFLD